MLSAIRITGQSKTYEKIQDLYIRSFPVNERGQLNQLKDDGTNHSEIIAFHEDECFCGFVCLLNYKDITHIIYFAIDEAIRGNGYGSLALALIQKLKPQNRIIADIEAIVDTADNNEQRTSRKQFYIRNGYHASGVAYSWQQEDYEILVSGGEILESEFEEFWEHLVSINRCFAHF